MIDLMAAAGPERIRDIDVDLRSVLARAYGWAAVGRGLPRERSDHGFDYFLGWLVGQGRARFEQAPADRDSLVEIVSLDGQGTFRSEELVEAAWTAYERAARDDPPDGPFIARPGLGPGWELTMRRRYRPVSAPVGGVRPHLKACMLNSLLQATNKSKLACCTFFLSSG